MQLKNGADKTDFIKAWGNPTAVNQVPTSLTDIAAMADQSVTLADIKAVWGVGAATSIVLNQLKGLFYFTESGSEEFDKERAVRKASQLMECAGLITDEFFFLTVSELLCWFRRLHTGVYGQLSWGHAGVNVQQLFTTMRAFQKDRKAAYDKLEAAKQQAESLERRAAGYVGAVQDGIKGHYAKCHVDFAYFCQAFPILLGGEHARAWWEYFKKDQNKAISDLFNLKTIKQSKNRIKTAHGAGKPPQSAQNELIV